MQKKGFALIEVLVFLFVILVFAGGYYLTRQVDNPGQVVAPNVTSIPTAIPTIGITMDDAFAGCSDSPETSSVALTNIPVTVDYLMLGTVTNPDQYASLTCIGDSQTGWVQSAVGSNYILRIYDSRVEEGGHGGPAFIASIGTAISTTDTRTISIYLVLGDAGPSYIADIPLRIRGVEQLQLTNGEPISVLIDTELVAAGDPQLIEILQPFGTTSDIMGDQDFSVGEIFDFQTYTIDQVEEAVRNYYLADVENLSEPIATTYAGINTILDAFSPK